MSGGPVRVADVPSPTIGPTDVLVRTIVSVISPGTERAMTKLAQSSLLAKARARPDLVRQVVKKAQRDGVGAALGATRARLSGDLPLGYAAAGEVVEVGDAVEHVSVGDLVATGGAGRANHAELQSVPAMLCVPVPDGVPPEDAAFATIAAIALHGLRLADVGPGSRVVVIGLGLVGQLAARLAAASGCVVAGIDIGEAQVATARAGGADAAWKEEGEATTRRVQAWSRERGADAVLVTAGGRSSAVMARVPELCRDRATVVVVGDVGVELDRRPYYDKELTVRFSRSYGPGRYERTYEEWGVDYPPGQVRWTEGRNLEAVLDLLAAGRLHVSDLVTHRFDIEQAAEAYAVIDGGGDAQLAVVLRYAGDVDRGAAVRLGDRSPTGTGVGLIGAGSFVQGTLLPAMRGAGLDDLVAVASASGTSAATVGARAGFVRAVAGPVAVIDDPDVAVVVVASDHASHGHLVVRALDAGKHVFCEKPLALTLDELDAVDESWRRSGRALFVGFNRRWSPAIAAVRGHLVGIGPLAITYRVNAGRLPDDHWYRDRRQGGRLVGEVCHFVDTAAAIVGAAAEEVVAVGSGTPVAHLDEDVALVLRYPDGSIATILYAVDGHPRMPKERIEVLGRGRSAIIDDFRSVSFDGAKAKSGKQEKGFVQELRAFLAEVRGEARSGDWATSSMRTTLAAAAALHGTPRA